MITVQDQQIGRSKLHDINCHEATKTAAIARTVANNLLGKPTVPSAAAIIHREKTHIVWQQQQKVKSKAKAREDD